MPSPGQLRERALFVQRSLDRNNLPAGPWETDGLQVWASITPLNGSEPVLQQRLMGLQPVAVVIRRSRASTAINSAWRMIWNGSPYNIKTVQPDARKVWINILAEADQTQGG